MTFLTVTDIFVNLVLPVGASIFISVLSAYIIIRERLLKTELKLSEIEKTKVLLVSEFDIKIGQIKEDIRDFKELNKETNKSLTENTAAIRELKSVLDLLKEQLLFNND